MPMRGNISAAMPEPTEYSQTAIADVRGAKDDASARSITVAATASLLSICVALVLALFTDIPSAAAKGASGATFGLVLGIWQPKPRFMPRWAWAVVSAISMGLTMAFAEPMMRRLVPP